MDTENSLPNNDPNVQLARTLGEILASNQSLSGIKDPLIKTLLDFKNIELSTAESIEVSSTVWEKIQRQTAPQRARTLPIFNSTTIAWASAAVLVIAAFIGIFMLNSQPDFELIAQSGTSIEQVILEDGTQVTLRPNSSLFKRKGKKTTKKREYALTGEAFFDVTKNPEAPFTVDGENGLITVLGTRFNVSTWGQKMVVYLEEGSVKFETSTTHDQVVLVPGEFAEISNGVLLPPQTTSSNTFTDWILNTIVFQNTTPSIVVAELSQHYGVTINIQQLEDQQGIDGTLRLDSPSQTLGNLGLVLGGTFRQISETEFEFIPME